jgi:hypothetical protein
LIDSLTWRFVLLSVLGTLAGLALAMGFHARSKLSSERGAHEGKAWIVSAIGVALAITTGTLAIVAFLGPATSVQPVSALFIVPVFHLAQAARGMQNSKVRGLALPVQCAWTGVLASLLLGVGSIVLVVFIRIGMAADTVVVACVVLVCASLVEAGLQVAMRGKNPSA